LNDRQPELLEINGAIVVFITEFDNLIDTLAINMFHTLIFKQRLEFVSID
jgi:hypothetical protein